MRRLAAVLSLFTAIGCKPSEPPPPTKAGVSAQLAYPVLLIGQGTLDVCDSEARLTNIRGASSLNLNERVILDSAGHVFAVKSAVPIAGQGSIMLDMGTSDRFYAVTVEDKGVLPWPDVQALVLAEVRNPRGSWAGDERAVRRVQALTDVKSLIAAARESWAWSRD